MYLWGLQLPYPITDVYNGLAIKISDKTYKKVKITLEGEKITLGALDSDDTIDIAPLTYDATNHRIKFHVKTSVLGFKSDKSFEAKKMIIATANANNGDVSANQ